MCGGGGGGSRDATQEEKDLWAAQMRSIDQGIRGRDMAMGSYEGFINRGRELGSTANLDMARDQSVSQGLAALDRSTSMTLGRLASRGTNLGDTGGMANALLGNKIDGAAAIVAGANDAANKQRSVGLQMETAGVSGMAGFDPTSSMNSLASSLNANATRSMQADAMEAQGWGNIAQAGMYGLQNADKIGKGVETVGKWIGWGGGAADGGYVQDFAQGGIVRPVELAGGGNVYDQAIQQQAGMMPQPSTTRGAPQGGGVDPISATMTASKMVDKASKFLAPKAGGATGGGQLAALDQIAPVGGEAAVDAAAQFGADAASGAAIGTDVAGAAGIDAAATAGASAAEGAAAAAAAEGAAGAGLGAAAGAIGTALPWVGGAMLLGSALGLFRDGGSVKPAIGKSSKTPAGRASNPAGGKVRGPGGPKDDKVPAWLSPGEFVMPVEAVQKYGLDRLESMRQKALNPNTGRNTR